MRLLLHFIFLTFVLLSPQVIAAPPAPSPLPAATDAHPTETDDKPSPTKTETIRIDHPKEIETEGTMTSLPQRHRHLPPVFRNLNIHIGTVSGDILDSGDALAMNLLGFRYIMRQRHQKDWDFTFDIHSKNIANTSVGRRWSFEDFAIYESYYRIGVSNYINVADQLSGLINLRHFKLMVSLGFSDLVEWDRQLVAEISAGYGLSGPAVAIQIGYAF